jgi:putative hydrolase of the HAD superfamily
VIRALLLDADGVVQLPRPTWRTSLEALCGDRCRADEFLADVFAAERPCLTGEADFEVALEALLRKWGAGVSVEAALQIWTQIEPSADILELARGLRASGVSVSLATNQQTHRAGFMSSALGYADHFDHLLYSCDLGHCKPSAEFFSSALARLMIDPKQVLFIDDHETNVSAARHCGLHAEVFHLSEGMERVHEILDGYGLGGT